ncbi:MAG: c-type cytochrome [Planctomycetota bacterium]
MNGFQVWRAFGLPLLALTLAVIGLMVGVLLLVPTPETPRNEASLAGSGPAVRARPAKVLFQELCSLCHGENGDGNGPTELERPARSFLEGGYAYGNTLSVIMRTLEHGIPGTAMPGFGETLSLQERTSLAQYVLSLGPPVRRVSIAEGNVASNRRPVVLHGALEDPTTGELEPRSLLVGFSDGTTAQYRMRDMALLVARTGDVDTPLALRADWRGQGGDPLVPLGDVAFTLGSGEAHAAEFTSSAGEPLWRRHAGTRIAEDSVVLRFDLVDVDGARLGTGTETIRSLGGADGGILARTVALTETAEGVQKEQANGEVVHEDSERTVRRIRDGLLSVDPLPGSPDGSLRRDYVHAPSWARGLRSAL